MTRNLVIVAMVMAAWVWSTNGQPRPPSLTSSSSSVLLREGQNLTLECPVDGAGDLRVQWFRNEQPATEKGSLFRRLTIDAVSRADAGAYRCSAENDVGALVSRAVNVTVSYLDDFGAVPEEFWQISASVGGYFVLTPPPLRANPLHDIAWRWYFHDAVVFPNRTHFVSSTGTLVVLEASAEKAGPYKVEATSALGRVSSRDYVVEMNSELQNGAFSGGDPTIALAPRDTVFVRTSGQRELVLECVAFSRSLDEVVINWHHNGTRIVPDGIQYELEQFSRRLRVNNPSFPKNSGVYACEATRSFTSAKGQAWVEIYEEPEITSTMPPETPGSLGQSITLPCRARGWPRPLLKWFKNAVPTSKSIAEDGSLIISSVTEEDKGIYQCEAINAAGSTLSTTWLRTEASGPVLSERPNNVSVTVGQEAKFLCRAVGAPPPQIHWKLNGSDVPMDGVNFRVEPGSLFIPTVTLNEQGIYSCIANNSKGTTEASAYLSVTGRAQIQNGPTNQSVVIGSNVMYPCEVSAETGRTHFSRNWYFNRQLLVSTSRKAELRPDGSLFIRQVGPSNIGVYTCAVTSPTGTENQSGVLSIIEKPGMPLGATAEVVNSTLPVKVRVAWKEGFDGNSPIIKYLVQARQLGPTGLWSDWESIVENVPREERSTLLDNLKPSASFQFRVIAVNRYGTGIPSVHSNNITMPQQPPAAAPRNVAGSARSSSSLMVQWQPPPADQWNGDILGYILRYRLADYAGIPWLERNISDGRARNLALEDLITWREYEVQVAAFNDRGMGVFSKPTFITTLEGVPTDSPSAVNVTVINSTSIYIEFVPPPQQMIPGVNQGYKVEFWKGAPSTGTLFKQVRVLPDVIPIQGTISGLQRYGHYNVTVLCFTAPGDGPRSPPIEIQTFEDIPGPVANMHFDDVQFSSVKVVWDPPNEPNGRLTNYTLRFFSTNNPSDVKTFTIAANKTSYNVEGLTAATHYSFELYASTTVGRGPSEEATMESGVPPELPGRPTSLVVTDVRARSAALQFTPGFDGNTIISRWIVEGRVGASTAWSLVYNISAPKARAIVVERLRPYTKYELRLVAENVKGRGPPSDAARTFETRQAEPEHPPEEMSAEPDSARSIIVSWTPLPSHAWNGDPKGYLLMYRQNDTDTPQEWKETLLVDIKSGEHRLTDLTPHSTYEVKMFSENTFGRSKPTQTVVAKTYEDVPTSAPRNVQAVPVSSRKIRVTWDGIPDSGANGNILGYRVRYLPSEDRLKRESGELDVIGADAREATVDRLRSFTAYHVYVTAFTVVGAGPAMPTPVVVFTAEDIPGPPSGVAFNYVSEQEVRIRWQPPYRPNGRITRYEIAFWKNTSDRDTAVRTQLPSDVFAFSANQLTPATAYSFAVVAETSVGWGEATEVRVYTTSRKVPPPTPPTPLQSNSREQGPRHLWIRWTGASSLEAPVRLVDVEYQQVNQGDWIRLAETFPGAGSEALIENLSPNIPYRVRVRFTNDFGQSQWSLESAWMKTLEAAPSLPPTEIEALPHDSSSLKVSWRPSDLSTWNSDFVGYRILYRPYEPNSTFQTEEVAMSGDKKDRMEHVIAGLPRFRHYLLQLQTFNQQGSSPSSLPAFVYVGYSITKQTVRGLQAVAISSTSISLRWDPWKQQDEPITGFKVRYKPVDFDEQWKEEVVTSDKGAIVLNDLRQYAKYQFVVAPYNKAGQGPRVEAVASTSEDRPGSPGPLVFNDILLSSVNVSWAPPENPNGRIVGYIVNYRTFKLKEEFKKEIQEKTTLNYLLASNLEENVTYFFSVRAETAVGYGPEVSGNVTIGPTVGSPEHPAKPRVYPAHSSVTLEWKNGAEGEAPITGYIVQAKRVRLKQTPDTTIRSKRSLGQGPDHPLGQWVILTSVQGTQPVYEVGYRELEPASFYRFRVFARNAKGVSYPSPDTDEVEVPEHLPDDPFYTKWWFLVILALASLVVIVVVIALLCVTGRNNKYKYEKRNSADSLQLADGGIVSYELRASQRATKQARHNRQHPPPRPDPTNAWIPDNRSSRGSDSLAPPAYGSVINGGGRGSKAPSMYGSLATDVLPAGAVRYGKSRMDGSQPHLDDGELETSTTGEGSDSDHEASIVQHYETSDVAYRDTWRRAKQSAAREQPMPSSANSFRPPSITSNQSDVNSQVMPHQHGHVRPPLPGFSSFV